MPNSKSYQFSSKNEALDYAKRTLEDRGFGFESFQKFIEAFLEFSDVTEQDWNEFFPLAVQKKVVSTQSYCFLLEKAPVSDQFILGCLRGLNYPRRKTPIPFHVYIKTLRVLQSHEAVWECLEVTKLNQDAHNMKGPVFSAALVAIARCEGATGEMVLRVLREIDVRGISVDQDLYHKAIYALSTLARSTVQDFQTVFDLAYKHRVEGQSIYASFFGKCKEMVEQGKLKITAHELLNIFKRARDEKCFTDKISGLILCVLAVVADSCVEDINEVIKIACAERFITEITYSAALTALQQIKNVTIRDIRYLLDASKQTQHHTRPVIGAALMTLAQTGIGTESEILAILQETHYPDERIWCTAFTALSKLSHVGVKTVFDVLAMSQQAGCVSVGIYNTFFLALANGHDLTVQTVLDKLTQVENEGCISAKLYSVALNALSVIPATQLTHVERIYHAAKAAGQIDEAFYISLLNSLRPLENVSAKYIWCIVEEAISTNQINERFYSSALMAIKNADDVSIDDMFALLQKGEQANYISPFLYSAALTALRELGVKDDLLWQVLERARLTGELNDNVVCSAITALNYSSWPQINKFLEYAECYLAKTNFAPYCSALNSLNKFSDDFCEDHVMAIYRRAKLEAWEQIDHLRTSIYYLSVLQCSSAYFDYVIHTEFLNRADCVERLIYVFNFHSYAYHNKNLLLPETLSQIKYRLFVAAKQGNLAALELFIKFQDTAMADELSHQFKRFSANQKSELLKTCMDWRANITEEEFIHGLYSEFRKLSSGELLPKYTPQIPANFKNWVKFEEALVSQNLIAAHFFYRKAQEDLGFHVEVAKRYLNFLLRHDHAGFESYANYLSKRFNSNKRLLCYFELDLPEQSNLVPIAMHAEGDTDRYVQQVHSDLLERLPAEIKILLLLAGRNIFLTGDAIPSLLVGIIPQHYCLQVQGLSQNEVENLLVKCFGPKIKLIPDQFTRSAYVVAGIPFNLQVSLQNVMDPVAINHFHLDALHLTAAYYSDAQEVVELLRNLQPQSIVVLTEESMPRLAEPCVMLPIIYAIAKYQLSWSSELRNGLEQPKANLQQISCLPRHNLQRAQIWEIFSSYFYSMHGALFLKEMVQSGLFACFDPILLNLQEKHPHYFAFFVEELINECVKQSYQSPALYVRKKLLAQLIEIAGLLHTILDNFAAQPQPVLTGNAMLALVQEYMSSHETHIDSYYLLQRVLAKAGMQVVMMYEELPQQVVPMMVDEVVAAPPTRTKRPAEPPQVKRAALPPQEMLYGAHLNDNPAEAEAEAKRARLKNYTPCFHKPVQPEKPSPQLMPPVMDNVVAVQPLAATQRSALPPQEVLFDAYLRANPDVVEREEENARFKHRTSRF